MPKQHDNKVVIHSHQEIEEKTMEIARRLTAFAENLAQTGDYHSSLLVSGFLWAAVYMAITPEDSDDPFLLTDDELQEVMIQALSDGFEQFRGVINTYH
jgi:hypothetical protein|tara:strand:+ start:1128 stop:1424 length:297 start_codon:yes stop_codon:yes gene_type:complete